MDEIEIMQLVIEGKDQTIRLLTQGITVMGTVVVALTGVIVYLYNYNQTYGKRYHNVVKKVSEALHEMARK